MTVSGASGLWAAPSEGSAAGGGAGLGALQGAGARRRRWRQWWRLWEGGRGTLVQATVAVRHPRLAAATPGAAGRSASFPGRNGTPGFAGPARKVCSGAATSRPARPSMKRR